MMFSLLGRAQLALKLGHHAGQKVHDGPPTVQQLARGQSYALALIGRHRTNGYAGLSFGGSSLRLRSCILPAMSTAATTTIRPIVSVSMVSAPGMIAAAAVQSRRGHRMTIVRQAR